MSVETELSTSSIHFPSRTVLKPSKKGSSEISKVYKHASQLYLTRRFPEAYETILPVITTPSRESRHDEFDDDTYTVAAPIATATTSQRIKIWSLYLTLMHDTVELGDEEGSQIFGLKLYSEIKRKVQSGDIWEDVVRDGYMGREASVDAEVIYNL